MKVAVVDATGKVVDTCAIFPHQPQKQWDVAKATLAALVARHGVQLIAIGNGTASRETDALATELIAEIQKAGATAPAKAMVSEAGASVYSASAYAAHELPDLDVTIRGAVSIARRLQDPLAELVKIEPEVDRRRAVSARRHAGHAGPQSGRRGGGRRERGRRRSEHRVRPAALPGLRRDRDVGQAIVAHREKSGRFASRKALLERSAPGPQGIRAVCGIPADQRW